MKTITPRLAASRSKADFIQKKFGPASILFISANIANAGNLAFNMIFARLMGPEAFADLTFLLTLKLGVLCVLSAFQLAFAKHTAKFWFGHNRDTRRPQLESYASKIVGKSFWVSLPLMFGALIFAESFARAFQFDDLKSLFILITIIPLIFPMIVYRGLSQGRIDLPRIVGSIQGEWIIRLLGGLLLWSLGMELSGIAIAVVLSILTASLFSMTKKDIVYLGSPKTLDLRNPPRLLMATAPFLALQFAQVLILDGDILLAKASMSSEFSGYVAGLMLIQRIFFFAFLSFSSLLIPVIAAKVEKSMNTKMTESRTRGRSDLMLMLGGIIGISVPALLCLVLLPSMGVSLLLGKEFLPIAHLTVVSGATGTVFTLTHLCVVYWLANGQHKIAWILLVFAIFQMLVLSWVTQHRPDLSISVFAALKLGLQSLTCGIFLLYTFISITDEPLTKRSGRRQRQSKDAGAAS